MKKLKRRYRKRRYKRYKSYYKRRRRSSTEVKVFDTANNGKGIHMDIVGDGTLRKVNYIFSNVLNGIAQGTNSYQRIGNRIVVKSMQLRCNYWTCGFTYTADGGTINYTSSNTGLMRVIVSNIAGGNSDTTTFYAGTNGGNKITCPLNRKVHNIFKDKVFRLQGGIANGTAQYSCTGDIRSFKMNIPINRTITYQQADSGTSSSVKDSNDYFSVSACSFIPNGASFPTTLANPTVTPVCSNWSLRIYYTDA